MEPDNDRRIIELTKLIAGEHFSQVVKTAQKISQETGKSFERALADSLEFYGMLGAVR